MESDEYGFVAAARVGLEMFDHSQRGTGRTTRLIERATDNDIVITATDANARHLSSLLRRAGKKTRVVVVREDRAQRYAGTADQPHSLRS